MKIRFGDIILAVLIVAAAVILIFAVRTTTQGEAVAVILRDGEEIYRAGLGSAQDGEVVHIDELGIEIAFEGGRVRFATSSCLDQTCVHTGWLSRAGDIAVCLPNGVIVKIEGAGTSDVDVVAE